MKEHIRSHVPPISPTKCRGTLDWKGIIALPTVDYLNTFAYLNKCYSRLNIRNNNHRNNLGLGQSTELC